MLHLYFHGEEGRRRTYKPVGRRLSSSRCVQVRLFVGDTGDVRRRSWPPSQLVFRRQLGSYDSVVRTQCKNKK